MPRRNRDYKAEYAAAKRRATAAGYESEREYKRARKALGIPRNASPIPKRLAPPDIIAAVSRRSWIRQQAADWSDKHSYVIRSQFNPEWNNDRVRRYHRTFVEPITGGSRRSRAKEKRRRIHDWLVPDWMDQKEWESKYQPI